MTKKHFISLADAIKRHNEIHADQFSADQLKTLANWCHSQNTAFMPGRWYHYIEGLCGPSGGQIRG